MFRRKSKFFKVVVNEDEEYSVWPTSAQESDGWQATGTVGSEADCWEEAEEKQRKRSVFRWFG
jgi:MbtH protein